MTTLPAKIWTIRESLNNLNSLGLAVDYDCLWGYSHVTEMEAIADINATPTALIVNFIETLLPYRVYLPLIMK